MSKICLDQIRFWAPVSWEPTLILIKGSCWIRSEFTIDLGLKGLLLRPAFILLLLLYSELENWKEEYPKAMKILCYDMSQEGLELFRQTLHGLRISIRFQEIESTYRFDYRITTSVRCKELVQQQFLPDIQTFKSYYQDIQYSECTTSTTTKGILQDAL